MIDFELIILDRLFSIQIQKNDFLKEDYQEKLNISGDISLRYRNIIITKLLDEKLISQSENYLGLTATGGMKWEKAFEVDWNLYYESEIYQNCCNQMQFDIYATSRNTFIKLFERYPNLFNLNDVDFINQWKPLYWKNAMEGYSYSVSLPFNELILLHEILPSFKKNIS